MTNMCFGARYSNFRWKAKAIEVDFSAHLDLIFGLILCCLYDRVHRCGTLCDRSRLDCGYVRCGGLCLIVVALSMWRVRKARGSFDGVMFGELEAQWFWRPCFVCAMPGLGVGGCTRRLSGLGRQGSGQNVFDRLVAVWLDHKRVLTCLIATPDHSWASGSGILLIKEIGDP